MAKMYIDAAACNHKGHVRGNNEDNFYANGMYMEKDAMNSGGLFNVENKRALQIYAVCDGMGGWDDGENASYTTVKTIKTYQMENQEPNSPAHLKKLMQNISNAVYQEAQIKKVRSGTTIAMALLEKGFIRYVHVGDSRIYRLRGGQFAQMTADHSEVRRMISMGILTEDEAKTHPKRHAITQYVGMPQEDALISPTITEPEGLEAGDRYLLCSDGLTDMVEDSDIETILSEADTAATAAKNLVAKALQHGGEDNITTLCLYVKETGVSGITIESIIQNAIYTAMALVSGGILCTLADILFFWFVN